MFLFELFYFLCQFVAGGGAAGGCGVFLQHLDAALDLAGEGHDVFGAQAGECALVVAVQIDQGLEGALFAAAEEPVDGALFVGLQVVFEELVGDVAADGLVRSLRSFGAQAMFSSSVSGPQTVRRNSRMRLGASSANQSSSVMGTMPSASAGKVA